MRITFTAEGTSKTVDADEGSSLMQVALANDIPGITADCGGNAMCATCHIYVDAADHARLPEMAEEEDEMLAFTGADRRATSRLACQIQVQDRLESIAVQVAAQQS
ncbi:ferredoxin [Nocardia panacis]|uniref:Ferredoxin n=1 Tax=Nocardia panacis TaxID=2340916 RepID=A0A3A4KMJ0_9NOCA|nr:2Fe-2S iron-sulfur cluster-binding protein [Nocardia panacis]RJO70756.1 ferredoxin [Nocardia panacis]